MSASIIPFRRMLTLSDLAQVSAWCIPLGPLWAAEPIHAEDETLGIALVAPSSRRDACGGLPFPAWQMERTSAGIAVFRAEDWETLGVFADLSASMDAVTRAEVGRSIPTSPQLVDDGEQTA